MAKTLKEIFEVYEPKSPDEKRFKDKHITVKTKDRNGNGDDVFQAKNIKTIDRTKESHGYNPGDDEKVYEEKMDAGDVAKEKKLKTKFDKSGMKAAMKKQYGAEKGQQVYFAKIRKMAMESVELDEAAAATQYDTHHGRAMKTLTSIMKHLDTHKKHAGKNSGPMSWHAYDMKDTARQLEDIEQQLAARNETQAMLSSPVREA
jgi:hypothetical protein